MNKTWQTELHGWMEKVQVAVQQTDARNPVAWAALEKLSWDEDKMPRLVKLLKKYCPYPSFKIPEEAAYLISVAYHNDNDSLRFILDILKAYIKKKDRQGTGGKMRMCGEYL